jgi:hypothetical protein
MAISEEGRKAFFESYERLGLERVKHDLLWTKGIVYVGGTLENQNLAWDWVRMKEAEQMRAQRTREDVLQLKPAIWGVGINLNELWRRLRSRSKTGEHR